MSIIDIKERICELAKLRQNDICRIGKSILEEPELGYKEEKTSAFIRDELLRMGLDFEYPFAITGVRACMHGKNSLANVCIMGEMDAVKCAGHPKAKADGAAHACGHHVQIAAMLGAAMLLKESGAMDELDGDVTFFAVPAEEYIELEYRKELMESGKIAAFGGKQQLAFEGALDGIDMAMMIHAMPDEPQLKVYTKGHNLGFTAKNITFRGKTAHASTPYDATNALNAAALAILGIHSNRETFKDEDKIRIHPIITKGGDVVNSVPDEVCVETYVRGATRDAIEKGSRALERSVMGAAQMIGACADIETLGGYLPLIENGELSDVFAKSAIRVLGEGCVIEGKEIVGSTDMGDISHIMPVIQPSVGGFCGKLHSGEFDVCCDEVFGNSALILALTVCDLLCDGADKARKIISGFKPEMSRKEYVEYLRGK